MVKNTRRNRGEYGSQAEAERAIAELGKAGLLKPIHLPGRHWTLTVNREGTISRTQLYHVLVVALRKRGQQMHPQEINRMANAIFAEAKQAAHSRRRPRSGRR